LPGRKPKRSKPRTDRAIEVTGDESRRQRRLFVFSNGFCNRLAAGRLLVYVLRPGREFAHFLFSAFKGRRHEVEIDTF
jgi:hypothetical protein